MQFEARYLGNVRTRLHDRLSSVWVQICSSETQKRSSQTLSQFALSLCHCVLFLLRAAQAKPLQTRRVQPIQQSVCETEDVQQHKPLRSVGDTQILSASKASSITPNDPVHQVCVLMLNAVETLTCQRL